MSQYQERDPVTQIAYNVMGAACVMGAMGMLF